MGPRVHDLELKDIVDIILGVRAGAYSLEAANPRHEHEWRVWQDVPLPEGKILIPGVITQSSVVVEHPSVVADRIGRFAEVVGRENVIAGSDCGFATFAGSLEIHPSIVWAKLGALAEGARLASDRLWRHGPRGRRPARDNAGVAATSRPAHRPRRRAGARRRRA
jgi:5-methyltetrahydropteroyltriglutamate--homocysteine methyltransferase